MDEYPILNLPEEVWDIILNLLEDSKDIVSATKAFPELDGVLQRKRCLWLFAEAFPALFRHFPDNMTLGCRLVCRRWSRAVDNFLETHPSLTPCKPGDKKLWHPLVSPTCRPLKFPRASFETQVKLEKFLEDTKQHSGERNPFIGRAIRIHPVDEVYEYEDGEDNNDESLVLEPFWRQATDLLSKFGKHVWYIEILPSYDQIPVNFCSSVVECLGRLPNLKKLVIANSVEQEYEFGDNGEYFLKDYLDSRRNSIPPLPQLESLLCQGIILPLVRTLVGWYAPQLRKLYMEIPLWKREYSKQLILPNLTELLLADAVDVDVYVLTHLLVNIEAPQLVSLDVKYECDREDEDDLPITAADPIVIGRDIFPWLNRFPHILHLCFLSSDTPVREGNMATDPFPSLKSFVITDEPDLGYNFLSSFPNLEGLSIFHWQGRTWMGTLNFRESSARPCMTWRVGAWLAPAFGNISQN